MKSIEEEQQEFIAAYNEIQDPLMQYEFLLRIGAELEPYPEEYRDSSHLISGCQSKVWIHCDARDDKLHIYADSEALIVKGIISVAVFMFQDQNASDIMKADVKYISDTEIKKQISTDRFQGVHSVITFIQDFAKNVIKAD